MTKEIIGATLLGALSLPLLTSCDPAKLIILKNRTDKPAIFRWTIRKDSADTTGGGFRTATFQLGTSKNDRNVTMAFGFGNWPAGEIERFVNDRIESIEIESVRGKQVMTDKKVIKGYLLERRHGILKNYITIKLK